MIQDGISVKCDSKYISLSRKIVCFRNKNTLFQILYNYSSEPTINKNEIQISRCMSYSTAVLASKVVSLQDRASYNVINNNASSGQNYNLSLHTYRKSLMLFPYKSNSHSFTFYSKEISRKNKACMYYRYTNCTNLRDT